jgi:type II secretory pathway pseudopilin PulG
MVKKSFTMIELIFVILIISLIAVGSFKSLQMLYERYYQVNTITHFSITSQNIINQISQIIYYRIPITAIGYNPDKNDFKPLNEANSSYKIVEWISEAFDAKYHIGKDIKKGYSGFIDLDSSNRKTLTLFLKDFNITDINDTENTFFNTSRDLNDTVAIIFAGTFDQGDESAQSDYNNSFGWHNHDHNKTFTIKEFNQNGNDAKLIMNNEIKGNKIFAKYYLANTAWALARGGDVNLSSQCITNLDTNVDDNTLFIFYDYRPWMRETFCADKNGTGQSGKVAILAKNVSSFRIKEVNYHIELKIQQTKSFYRGNDKNISISKQKVSF